MALAESIRQFGIELKRVDISDELRDTILSAQNRQDMINELYPFKHVEATGRAYTDKQKMQQFKKDGFISRYSAQKLVNSEF